MTKYFLYFLRIALAVIFGENIIIYALINQDLFIDYMILSMKCLTVIMIKSNINTRLSQFARHY